MPRTALSLTLVSTRGGAMSEPTGPAKPRAAKASAKASQTPRRQPLERRACGTVRPPPRRLCSRLHAGRPRGRCRSVAGPHERHTGTDPAAAGSVCRRSRLHRSGPSGAAARRSSRRSASGRPVQRWARGAAAQGSRSLAPGDLDHRWPDRRDRGRRPGGPAGARGGRHGRSGGRPRRRSRRPRRPDRAGPRGRSRAPARAAAQARPHAAGSGSAGRRGNGQGNGLGNGQAATASATGWAGRATAWAS